MQALTFSFSAHRLAAAKMLGSLSPSGFLSPMGPLQLANVPDPRRHGDDWVLIETHHAGICDSDLKQVFLDGAMDNPLTSLISFPHVMGQEVVGTVRETGSDCGDLALGDRVVVYPWLSCAARGLPLCGACRSGSYSTCHRLAEGNFAPGMRIGNCRDVSGAFAPLLAAHASMCFHIPDAVSFGQAVLADPFAVCLRALSKARLRPGQRVVVFGCGAIGMMMVHVISRLFSSVEVWAVDRSAALESLALEQGAFRFTTATGEALVEEIGAAVDCPPQRPKMSGMPWLLGDGVDHVIDTVGAASTIEAGLRVVKPRGTIVLVGVDTPKRFEWTPLYYKELNLVGSNSAGVEVFERRRGHSFQLYLDFLTEGRVDPAALISHHFSLSDYQEAFLTARDKERTGAVKVLFDF